MMAALGLDEGGIAKRKTFLEFTDEDAARLERLHALLAGQEQDFARRFYDHLLRFEETRRFIPDQAALDHLRTTQAQYFETLTAGTYDAEYVRHRLRVGLAHQRIGLETQWYLGAYAKYLSDALPDLWQRLGGDPDLAIATLQSLLKIVLFDMGLAMDTYVHADRQAILSLREYAELVFSAIPDGLAVLTADLTVISINRAFARRFELSEADAHGRPLATLIRAEGLDRHLREVRESGIVKRDLLFEMARVPDGPLIPVRATLTGIRLAEEEEEEEARLLLIVEDMTEQARLQDALLESEATLLRAQEVARIGSWRLDLVGGDLTWSPEVFRIFGIDRNTSVSYAVFLACVHPEDREMVDAAWQAALAGAPYHLQHRILAAGETRWVEERAQIEFDDERRPIKAVGTVQDITDRKAAETRIEYLAFYDPLTGLPNRALFMDRLHHELAAAERRGQRLAVLFLDLDRFKDINDTLGHDAGDRVLVEVARRFRDALREEETLARLSGDEFVVIASDSGKAAVRIAERVAQALAHPINAGRQEFGISASIGIAIFPEDGKSSEELLKAADIAMYRAKGGGGGGYRFYRAEMGEELARRLAIAQRLEKALFAGRLQLHYQPQVNLMSRSLIGAEALARWTDSEWGAVSPADFIPIAEERGLIVPLGEWALATACRQVRQWEARGCPASFRVAVNVSARQFEDDGFVDAAIRIARENKTRPALVELELTESGMMRDPDRAVEITHALAAAGFALSIDDFGTGYSSLTYLKRFPVKRLKIDISFVRDMLSDRNDRTIVGTVIAMGSSMDMETLAEGVEHADQASALLAMGCSLAQGFHFGRPEPADGFEARWLAKG
ncbi:EAL domain-containing protein [Sulfuricystis multivorans]|uniref:EAL domain-containing protein n=1 Tax=Sulfuricystis multivorans TaxID=2211108 RepID=UPI00155890FB|nr:EAL domain-containing protein [Sulfuricystis multivorans]